MKRSLKKFPVLGGGGIVESVTDKVALRWFAVMIRIRQSRYVSSTTWAHVVLFCTLTNFV